MPLHTLFSWASTGAKEERLVASHLKTLHKLSYAVINDILLPSAGNTSYAQIDHVVVSRFGIFCIETKSHIGWIYGNHRNEYWDQYIFKNKFQFRNPLHQNYGHIKALERVLSHRIHSPISSLIVFPNADQVKVDGNDTVGDISDILEKIENCTDIIYTAAECEAICETIKAQAITSGKARVQHVSEIQSLVLST
jgi:hypothetical protein